MTTERTNGKSPPDPAGRAASDIGELYELESAPMLRMATLLVGSAAIAEEVVQDAFEVVGRRWDEIERKGGYLRTTVVHGCAAILRRREIEARHRATEIVAAHVELPTHLLELRDALERLSDRQRIVIVLRYFVDLPDAEIAEVLDVRPATVRSLARRALEVLRHELREEPT